MISGRVHKMHTNLTLVLLALFRLNWPYQLWKIVANDKTEPQGQRSLSESQYDR